MSEASDPVLTLKGLVLRRAGFCLGPVHFTLERGQRLGLLGVSGSGKSSLLRSMAGLESSLEGQIVERKGRVASLLQDPGLWDSLSAEQNVGVVVRSHRGTRSANHWLDRVSLRADRQAPVSRLSGGERQRVALARVLACPSDLILLDEPSTHLDPRARQELFAVLSDEFDERGSTLVVATHHLEEVLALKPTHVLLLDQGQAVGQGDVASVFSTPRSVRAARLLGYSIFLDQLPAGIRTQSKPHHDRSVLWAWRRASVRLDEDGEVHGVLRGRTITEEGPAVLVELGHGESCWALGTSSRSIGESVGVTFDEATPIVEPDRGGDVAGPTDTSRSTSSGANS